MNGVFRNPKVLKTQWLHGKFSIILDSNDFDGLAKSPRPSLRGAKRRGNLPAIRALLRLPRFARNDKPAYFRLFTNPSYFGMETSEGEEKRQVPLSA